MKLNNERRQNLLATELMEKILEEKKMMQAYKKVKSNKGACGIDGIGTDEIRDYLIEKLDNIKIE